MWILAPRSRACRLTLVSLGLLLTVAIVAAEPPKDRATASSDSARDQVRRLYSDDLPYAQFVREIMASVDAVWPNLDEADRRYCDLRIYNWLASALRHLTDHTGQLDPLAQRHSAAVEIAFAMKENKFGKPNPEFYKQVFASDEFTKSTSVYHDAVIDLWQRYEAAGMAVPYAQLLNFNDYRSGHPEGLSGDMMLWPIAEMYGQVGDHLDEAKWYLRVSPKALGPLKAGDAFFAAGKREDAAVQYNIVLTDLEDWAKLKVTLRSTQWAEPLESADLDAIRKHATAQLEAINRANAKGSTTHPS